MNSSKFNPSPLAPAIPISASLASPGPLTAHPRTDFHDIIVSMKASDVRLAIEAYEKAAQAFDYPLHLGITESGTLFSGTIKSAAGIGALLSKGIGNTLRISLSADPVEEVKVARELLKVFGLSANSSLFLFFLTNIFHLLTLTNISGIYANFIRSPFNRNKGKTIIKVDIHN